jgi:hypothetical protein
LAFGPVKARQYIQEAFNDWAKHTGLTFRQAIGYEKADFNLAFVYGHHGDGFPLGGSTLGILKIVEIFILIQANHGQIRE